LERTGGWYFWYNILVRIVRKPSTLLNAIAPAMLYGLVLLTFWGRPEGHGITLPFSGWGWLIPAGSVVVVALRRAAPWTMLVAMLALEMTNRASGVASEPFGTAVMLGNLAVQRGDQALRWGCALALGSLALSIPLADRSIPGFVTSVMVAAAGAGIGALLVRTRLQSLRVLRLQAQDRKRRTAFERSEHRAALGREVHDVLTSTLTVIARLSDAAVLDRTLTVGTREIAVQIGRSARAGLTDVHDFVRASVPAPTSSQSTVESIVAAARAAGVEVDLTVTGTAPDDALDRLVVRVVQESVANALQHAEPTRVSVAVHHPTYGSTGAVIVENDGVRARATQHRGHRPGYGVAGVVARLDAVGGSCTVGSGEAAGTWRVVATLPALSAREMSACEVVS